MSDNAANPAAGFFYVLSAPKDSLSLDEYHDWYNHEHGPLRLQLDWIRNGYRYVGRDSAKDTWMACYDLEKLSGFDEPSYTKLRNERSLRESLIVQSQLRFLDRRIYSLFSCKGSVSSPPPVALAVTILAKDADVSEIDTWYEEEHIELLSKIPGWLRSRRFRLDWSEDQKDGITELLAVHDFAESNGLGGPEHEHARTTPWRDRVFEKIGSSDRKTFDLKYDLKADDDRVPDLGSTSEISLWRMDGNTQDPKSPVIAFSNSLLSNFHIWDSTITTLRKTFPTYRFLRYNSRGYASKSDQPVSFDLLTKDLANLLNHLAIEKCHAIIGVSMGGMTTLNFASKFPHRLEKFIACACNTASSPEASDLWADRIAVMESDNGQEKLADMTVARWFVTSPSDPVTPGMKFVKATILAASAQGGIDSMRCLQNYDVSEKIKHIQIPGLCVVGAMDGLLPQVMAELAKTMANADCVVIPDAGHLPMVQNPDGFTGAISQFLK